MSGKEALGTPYSVATDIFFATKQINKSKVNKVSYSHVEC